MARLDLLTANDVQGQYPGSWYAATAEKLPVFPPPSGQIKTEICVIGGGFTGLSSALHLAEAGHDVVLLDAQRVGWGASGRNGGQVGSGQRQDQRHLTKHYGAEIARQLWENAEAAKATIARLIKKHDIECYYKPGVAHVFRDPSDVEDEWAEADFLATQYGYDQIERLDAGGTEALFHSDHFKGGQIDWGAGHIHPLRLALGMAKAAATAGVKIYENARVSHLSDDRRTAYLDGASITSEHMIIACNGYLQDLEPKTAARVMPINNFILATEPLENPAHYLSQDVAVADDKFVVNYWRLSHDGRMIYGGGENYSYRFPKDIASVVKRHMLEIYPALSDTKVDYVWGGTLGITAKRLPYFAEIAPNVWSASGYSGHGVALATEAGRMIAHVIDGNQAGFAAQAALKALPFPGGGTLRHPLMVAAMTWYALRDRLGF